MSKFQGNFGKPSGLTQAQADELYVLKAGDTMSGDLKFPDGTKVRFGDRHYIFSSGNLVELDVNNAPAQTWEKDAPAVTTGESIGLLLGLTYTA